VFVISAADGLRQAAAGMVGSVASGVKLLSKPSEISEAVKETYDSYKKLAEVVAGSNKQKAKLLGAMITQYGERRKAANPFGGDQDGLTAAERTPKMYALVSELHTFVVGRSSQSHGCLCNGGELRGFAQTDPQSAIDFVHTPLRPLVKARR
jgi:hypothetical protein